MLDSVGRDSLARVVYAGLRAILQYLHGPRVAVAHGDICPRNLIVGESAVHLIDFGNAKAVDADLTQHDLYGVAQPSYISPDQARGAWACESDLYQLGLILYEIMTGRRYNPGTDFRSCRLNAAAAEVYSPGHTIADDFWSKTIASLLVPQPCRRICAADLPPLP